MTAEELATTLSRDPFVPVRLDLSDGGKPLVLAARGRALVTLDRLVAMESDDPFAPPEQRRMRVVPLTSIRSVEDLNIQRPRRG